MKLKRNKVIATSMALLMMGTMAGCGNGGNAAPATTTAEDGQAASSTDSNETITLDAFSEPANYQGLQTGWYGKLLKDKFNIELNIIAPNVAGGGDTLYQTRAAAGNMGDIIVLENVKMKECVEAGIMLDLTPYLKNTKYIKNYQLGIDNIKNFIGGDGIYGLPINASTEAPTTPSLFANKLQIASYMPFDYYQELGAPEMKDTEDLLNVMEQMQKNHPTTESGKKTYGFSFYKDWDGPSMALAEKFASTYGYAGTTDSVYTNADATKSQLLIDDNSAYYNALKTYFEANQRGLVDPDSSAQNFDGMMAKITDRQVLYLWWAWMMGNYNTKELGEKGIGYTYIPVGSERIVTDGFNPYGDGYSIGIGAKAKNPEKIMEFLDWSCSPEGVDYYAGNLKGLTYEIVDGRPKLTDYGRNAWGENSAVPDEFGGGNYKDGYPQINATIVNKSDTNPDTGESYDVGSWKSSLEDDRTLLDDTWTKVFGAHDQLEYVNNHNLVEVIPGCAYTKPSESSELQNERTQCGELVKETSWKMVFAKDEAEFNALWENMKTDLKGFGYDDVIKADQAIVEEFRKSREESVKAAK